MAKQKNSKIGKTVSKNEKYTYMLFSILKKREHIVLSDKEMHFNNTELRLISEVLSAKYEGKRLISTQLAKLLGVTRSAISQIVNRLEEQGVVRRVADEVDRKIAYIEITDETLETYSADLKNCMNFVGRVVNNFGEDNFNAMCELFDGFMKSLESEQKRSGLSLNFGK